MVVTQCAMNQLDLFFFVPTVSYVPSIVLVCSADDIVSLSLYVVQSDIAQNMTSYQIKSKNLSLLSNVAGVCQLHFIIAIVYRRRVLQKIEFRPRILPFR